MAVPASFDESNLVLDKPANMNDEQCEALSVHYRKGTSDSFPQITSLWKLTKDELEEVNRNNGRVWVTVLGASMPPIVVSGISPFRKMALEDDTPT